MLTYTDPKETQLQRLVINAIKALDAIVMWRDDNLNKYDSSANYDQIEKALCEAEVVADLLSKVVEKL